MTRMLVALLLLAPAVAQAQTDVAVDEAVEETAVEKPALRADDEMPPGVDLALGAGMLAAGVGMNALVFLVTDESVFHDSSGESGLALAIPPVLLAGGVESDEELRGSTEAVVAACTSRGRVAECSTLLPCTGGSVGSRRS